MWNINFDDSNTEWKSKHLLAENAEIIFRRLDLKELEEIIWIIFRIKLFLNVHQNLF